MTERHRSSRRESYGRREHEVRQRRSWVDLDVLDFAVPILACVVCGCTDVAACPGGCWWAVLPPAGDPLCSNCVPVA